MILKISLSFSPEKSEVVVVGKSTGCLSPENIRLRSHFIKPSSSISCFGLPIGFCLKHAKSLLPEFLSENCEVRTNFLFRVNLGIYVRLLYPIYSN